MKKKKIIKRQNKVIKQQEAKIKDLENRAFDILRRLAEANSKNFALMEELSRMSDNCEDDEYCYGCDITAEDIAEFLVALLDSKSDKHSCHCNSKYTADDVVKVAYDKTHTVIYWADGTKTISECDKVDMDNGLYDARVGFLISLAKKAYGSRMVNLLLKKYFPTPVVEKQKETEKFPVETTDESSSSNEEVAKDVAEPAVSEVAEVLSESTEPDTFF